MRNKLLVLISLLLAIPTAVLAADWRPIEPGDAVVEAPRVEKDADAEAMFWDVWVTDEMEGSMPRTVLSHYVRVKIFTERGKETQGTVDLYSLGDFKIQDVAGRTIRKDGSIVELKKEAVFQKVVVKYGGLGIRATSFAMPAVEPGAIIEYRWREVRRDQVSNYTRLYYQREIPVWRVTYHIKPLVLPYVALQMQYIGFNCPNPQMVDERGGFRAISYHNMPALRDEPFMPPADEVRAWGLLYYIMGSPKQPDKFWKAYGKEAYRLFKSELKVNDEIRKLSAELVTGAATPEEKLARLSVYCRAKIKNIYHDSTEMTDEARREAKDNKNSADTLKHGMGTGHDINVLFAALSTAAGFEPRLANVADRSDKFFQRDFPNAYFMRAANVAVRTEGGWRFYDPASPYIPAGMLRWQEEGQEALVSDQDEPVFVRTVISGPEKSVVKRRANLRLQEDGTIEGDVTVEHTGHWSVQMKNDYDGESPEQREESLREEVKRRMSTAEVEDIKIENVTEPEKPLVYSYKVSVPGYAQSTGRRLLLRPAFFQFNLAPMFSASERKYGICFQYPWSEEDVVTFEVPEGYELESPDAPQSSKIAQIGNYDVRLQMTRDHRKLTYGRKFTWGNQGAIMFAAEAYPQMKQIFEFIHRQDNHTLALRQGSASK